MHTEMKLEYNSPGIPHTNQMKQNYQLVIIWGTTLNITTTKTTTAPIITHHMMQYDNLNLGIYNK